MPHRNSFGKDPIELEDNRQDLVKGRLALAAAALIAVAVLMVARPNPGLVAGLLIGGGVIVLSVTPRGSRARTAAQLFLGLASVVSAAGALGALGLSGAIMVQGVRGADLGFGGVFVLIGFPVGLGLAFLSLTLASLALGGKRRRSRGADGLTYREPPAFP